MSQYNRVVVVENFLIPCYELLHAGYKKTFEKV